MKYSIVIDESLAEDIVIHAKSDTELLRSLEAMLCQYSRTIMGRSNQAYYPINGQDIYCVYIENGKVLAQTKDGNFQIRERLSQLEKIYQDRFLKINRSCLINISQIQRFEASLGGSLVVILKNGYRDYISRRQLKSVKERFGL